MSNKTTGPTAARWRVRRCLPSAPQRKLVLTTPTNESTFVGVQCRSSGTTLGQKKKKERKSERSDVLKRGRGSFAVFLQDSACSPAPGESPLACSSSRGSKRSRYMRVLLPQLCGTLPRRPVSFPPHPGRPWAPVEVWGRGPGNASKAVSPTNCFLDSVRPPINR